MEVVDDVAKPLGNTLKEEQRRYYVALLAVRTFLLFCLLVIAHFCVTSVCHLSLIV